MSAVSKELLDRLQIGDPQTYRGLTLVPLFGEFGGPEYVTLGEALASAALSVGEVSAGGSVPELQAANHGDMGVLILDGEELVGAKQNRVLNASMFIQANSSVVLPVSCTEQGRWSYTTERFGDSGVVAEHNVRRRKVESVNASLRQQRGYRSDQGAVWDEVQALHLRHGVASRTGAMREVFQRYEQELSDLSDVIGVQHGQVGVAVAAGSRVLGFDVVSQPSAYEKLHRKLLWSYTLGAVAEDDPTGGEEAIRTFIDSLADATEEQYPAPGAGNSVRFNSPVLVGQALVVDDAVLHAVVFPGLPQPPGPMVRERMSEYAARRRLLGRN